MVMIIPCVQVKCTSKIKSIGKIENVDKFNLKKIKQLTDKIIFNVELLDSYEADSTTAAAEWTAEHPNICNNLTKSRMKQAVKNQNAIVCFHRTAEGITLNNKNVGVIYETGDSPIIGETVTCGIVCGMGKNIIWLDENNEFKFRPNAY